MAFPRIVKSDLGPEYSMGFTQELSRYGISHEGQIPNTSNQQGSVEPFFAKESEIMYQALY